jgi:hypothetical protein
MALVGWIRRMLSGRARQPVPSTGGGNGRRQFIRHPCNSRTIIQADPDSAPQPYEADIHDISQGGIGLQVKRPFWTGDLIHVAMPGSIASGQATNLLVCVVHIRQHLQDSWILGCSFIRELSLQQMDSFLPAA